MFSLTVLNVPEIDGRKQPSATPAIHSLSCWDPSVHFDHTVDLGNKPETGKEADCTWGRENIKFISAKLTGLD